MVVVKPSKEQRSRYALEICGVVSQVLQYEGKRS